MNEHKNIITIEDEIKEFSDKPVKSSALYKKVKELESTAVPDASEASVGDVLTKGEDGIGWSAPSGGGGDMLILTPTDHTVTPGESHSSIYLCPLSTVLSVIDEETGAITKPLFINVPTIGSLADTEWREFEGLVFCGKSTQLFGEEALYSYGSINVFLVVSQSAVILAYQGR